MNITKAKYFKDVEETDNSSISATIDGILMSVPIDPNNRHYKAIQEWVKEGNKIEDAD